MSNIYTTLHHLIDKQGARDESTLRDLHDSVSAHELGYGSLEEMRAEQRAALNRVDPKQLEAAQAEAAALLKQINEQQQLVVNLLKRADENAAYQREQAASAEGEKVAAAGAVNDPFRQVAKDAAGAGDGADVAGGASA